MSELIEAARHYLGTPFTHQGRMRGVGVDCVGLVACAAADAGIELPDVPRSYGRTPDGSLERELARYCERVLHVGLVQPGDLLLFRIYSLRPRHVAIVTQAEPLAMIHAYQGADTVAEHLVDDWWRARLHSVWRLRA
jgi:NlpC/P60 family putative phage cell wall peptidase